MKRTHRSLTQLAICIATATLACEVATANGVANLITNGHFDTDLSSWDNVSPGKSWSDDDFGGAPDSGSAAIDNGDTNGTGVYISQCVQVAGGGIYYFGGGAKLSTEQTATGSASIRLGFFTQSDCTQGGSFGGAPYTDVPGSTWVVLQGQATAPLNARSAELSLEVDKLTGGPANNVSAHFDDVYLTPEPGAFAAGLAALAALVSLSRRVASR